MKSAEPYARAAHLDGHDAIVIGSGIGGLGAAALLARYAGKRVLVLERHYTPGGYTHVFHRPGYEWDVGVHYIGDVHPGARLRAVFDALSDGALQWADMGPVYDRVLLGGEEFHYVKGQENLRRALEERFPAEKRAIAAYFRLVARAAPGPSTSSWKRRCRRRWLPSPGASCAGPFSAMPGARRARCSSR